MMQTTNEWQTMLAERDAEIERLTEALHQTQDRIIAGLGAVALTRDLLQEVLFLIGKEVRDEY